MPIRTATRLLVVTWLAAGSAPLFAQRSPADLDRALQQIVTDYTALYAKETLTRWRALFLPSFSSASVTAEGGVTVRDLDAFYTAQERGFAAAERMGERLENVWIDRRGRLASVHADFEYWNNADSRRGRLVLTAIHGPDGWRFHSLMFSYHE